MEQKHTLLAPADEEGFASYMRPGLRIAAQMPEAFTIQGMRGKAGDYLVLGGESGWPVDREIFEQTYTPVEPKSSAPTIS